MKGCQKWFAGGCFWCMTKPFDKFDGIEKVTSEYMGGHTENPSCTLFIS